MINVIEKKVPSSDGVHELAGRVYLPEGEPKGLFHVVHGMTEHIGRYDRFMRAVAEAGFVCFGYDHLGHGHTAKDESELGFIAKKDGWKLLAEDVAVFADAMKAEYGEDLHYILMGHSMGSFVVRTAVETSFIPDRLVVMGTGGPNPSSGAAIALLKFIKLFRGGRAYSGFVEKLAFGKYNERFADENDPLSWLTKDKEIRRLNVEDKFCGFRFTVSALLDLVKLTAFCNKKKWFKNIDKSLPILLVSGTEDPVGAYGKGVKTVYERLKAAGAQVEMKLYENCRHEILNDTCKEETTADVLEFALRK
ncbi:MAG: alpha/beta fold hydrolase [Clostridia bacterium]|nr:alpha/beta fold hydrolase [Clostridia bacterium]